MTLLNAQDLAEKRHIKSIK